MSEMKTAPQNMKRVSYDLVDLLELHKKDILLSLNCHAIATIQSFDPVKQTVEATINYKKTSLRPGPKAGIYVPVTTFYPVLIDCPAIILRGGNAALTLPITKGDTCLILFNDRDIDQWFKSGQVGPVATQRLHSISDGIALIGLSSLANPLPDYDPDRAVLYNGEAKVAIGPSLIEISNNLFTLNELLQELVTDVKNLVTQTAAITVTAFNVPPSNAAAIIAVGVQLTATATKIGELLE